MSGGNDGIASTTLRLAGTDNDIDITALSGNTAFNDVVVIIEDGAADSVVKGSELVTYDELNRTLTVKVDLTSGAESTATITALSSTAEA